MCALSKKDYLFRKTDCKLLSRRVSFDKKKVYPKRISEAGGAQYRVECVPLLLWPQKKLEGTDPKPWGACRLRNAKTGEKLTWALCN